MHRPEGAGWWLVLLLLVAGCQPRPTAETPPGAAPWPEFDFGSAARADQPVYRLDESASRVDIVVRRGGALARLGHDHVIVATSLEGFALWPPEPAKSHAELRLPVRELDVDPAAARRQYALDTQPDQQAIEATRRNLQNKVLEADTWPDLRVVIDGVERVSTGWQGTVSFTVRGQVSIRRIPLAITARAATLNVRGRLALTHAELGLEPFTALAGGLRVADPIEVYYDLALRREKP